MSISSVLFLFFLPSHPNTRFSEVSPCFCSQSLCSPWFNFTYLWLSGFFIGSCGKWTSVFGTFVLKRMQSGVHNVTSTFQLWPYLFILLILINSLNNHRPSIMMSQVFNGDKCCFLLLISQSSEADKYSNV